MVEKDNKYVMGDPKFGSVNWIGFITLYKKEVLRFFTVWVQTLLSPVITSLLFLSKIWGNKVFKGFANDE